MSVTEVAANLILVVCSGQVEDMRRGTIVVTRGLHIWKKSQGRSYSLLSTSGVS